MFKQTNLPTSSDPVPNEWQPKALNGGVVYSDLPQNLKDNQSPDMLNLWYREKVLTKRYGQEYLTDSLGEFPILQVYHKKFKGKMIYTASDKMYSLDLTTKISTQIFSGLPALKGSFFEFKNSAGQAILYYKNNGAYVRYDGTTVSNVVGYIPTVLQGGTPSGGGTVVEQYNRLSPGFTRTFSTPGGITVFQLPLTNLDATTVTAIVNGVTKVEGTDFTVNRVTGQVTFSVAPAAGTDTVSITAYKTDTASLNAFMINTYTITFGGDNDTRVFFAGGSNTYYYSGLLDPTFIPENQYNNAGVSSSQIYGFGTQYNVLVVLKEDSLYAVTYSFDGTKVSFPMAQLNDNSGCDMPWTIGKVNDNLVWCHSETGMSILNSTLIKDEKNVSPISFNINGTIQHNGLLQNAKADLQAATSYNYFGMYWLCVGSNVYAWDYEETSYVNQGNDYENANRLAWFPFNNINANCFFDDDGELYYGDRTVGRIIHFINSLDDFGNSINGYWTPKLNGFGLFGWTKYIMEVKYSSKTDRFSTVTTDYYWDKGTRTDSKLDVIASFSWARAKWNMWTWRILKYAITITKYPKIRDTVYFQCKLSNNIAGQNLSILDFMIRWLPYRQKK